MPSRTILLVSRQPELRRQLRVMSSRQGSRLIECRRLGEVTNALMSEQPDLILLDLSGYEEAAAEVTDVMRMHDGVPLIALAAADEEQHRLAALRAGADDCLVLPVGSNELVSRVRAALERTPCATASSAPDAFRAGVLDVDFVAREVRLRGKPVHLTPTEFKLLKVLTASVGKVVTHERLLREVWGPAAIQRLRQLRVHMKQLRRKFELPSARYLIAEAALGYRLWVPA